MKARMILVSTLLFCGVMGTHYTQGGQHSFKPAGGYVPTEETAIRIAEAVWIPIYGKDRIDEEKPFKSTLKDGVWMVRGTLHCPGGGICAGGVAEAEISKESGCILRISHGK